jgi:hypothetical protein
MDVTAPRCSTEVIGNDLGTTVVRREAAHPGLRRLRFGGCVAGITLRRDEAHQSFQSGSNSEQAIDELRLPLNITAG